MDEECLRGLQEAGIDVEEACERFMGNISLYQKFLLKFLKDNNYEKLTDAINEGDSQEAFMAAHALKGLCGNLSLTELFRLTSDITEFLRAGDLEHAVSFMPEVTKEYDRIVAVIASFV